MWHPPVQKLHWAEFRQVNEAADIGYAFASEHMDQIRALIDSVENKPWLARQMDRLRSRKPIQTQPAPIEWRGIWEVEPLE